MRCGWCMSAPFRGGFCAQVCGTRHRCRTHCVREPARSDGFESLFGLAFVCLTYSVPVRALFCVLSFLRFQGGK